MSSDPDNFVEVDDGPVEFNMEQDFLQSNGLGPLLNSDSANGPNFVELDQGLEGQRGTDRSAAPDHNMAGDPSHVSIFSRQQLPEGIPAEMLDRLRVYYVAKEKRERSYATAYKPGKNKAGDPVLRHDLQKRTAADQKYQKELTDNGFTEAIIEDDLLRLKMFLVKRGLEYGDIVIDGRKTLIQKLKDKYLGEEIDEGFYFGVPDALAELAEMISIVLCYRTGLPLMLTAETSEDITFPDGYFPAQHNPDTKADLGANLWKPVVQEPDDKDVLVRTYKRAYLPEKVLNEDEPGLRLGWTEWTDDFENNQSPFVTRFHLIDELYEYYYSVEEWRKLIYTSHPVCLFIDRYFRSQSQIINLANAIREKDIGERNQRLIDFILEIIAQMDASIAKLKADLTVDHSWNIDLDFFEVDWDYFDRDSWTFDLNFFKVKWDYVDWGKHRMLLALAGSELVTGKEDPLFALIQKDLIPDLDVYTWTEIINYGLMAAGVVFAIATFGWGTLLAAPLFALEMVITVGGLGMAAIDFYQAFEEAERMRLEAIYGQIDDGLLGFESDANLTMAGGMLVLEVLLTIVFPPSRAVVRSGSQIAARTAPGKALGQADIPPNGVTKAVDNVLPPTGQTAEVIEELGDEAIEELGADALEELADDVPGMGRRQDGEPESAISGSERSLEPEGPAAQSTGNIRIQNIEPANNNIAFERLRTRVDEVYPLVPLRPTLSLDEMVDVAADAERAIDRAIKITDDGMVDLSSLPVLGGRLNAKELANETVALARMLEDIPVVRAAYRKYLNKADDPKTIVEWIKTVRQQAVVLELQRIFSLDYIVLLREIDNFRGGLKVSERLSMLRQAREAIESAAKNNPFPGSFDDVLGQVTKKETVWLKNTQHVAREFGLESIGSNQFMRQLHDEAMEGLKSSVQGNKVTTWLSHIQEINRTVSNVPHNQMVDTKLLKDAWKAYRDKFKQVFIRHHGPNGKYVYARMIGDIHHMRLKSINPYHMLKASNLYILPPLTERSMKLHLMLHYAISGGEGFRTALPRMDR